MELRNLIARNIKKYLNEQKTNKKDKQQFLYRGFSSKTGFGAKSDNAVLFFSPSLDYAKTYGDDSVMVTKKPDNIFDVRYERNFNVLKKWLLNVLESIIEEKKDDDGFLPPKILSYINDAQKLLKSDNPKDLISAMSNISFAYFNGKFMVGVLEKMFMDEYNIDHMYYYETGLIKTENDLMSVMFRKPPKNFKIYHY